MAHDARAPTLHVRGRRVLVTGHTGFKGSWLCEWLLQRGAEVYGIALPPETPDALCTILRHEERLDHALCDVRDAAALSVAVQRADPEIVFHLAAQALVRRSYRDPLLTWQTNLNGTLNLLEAVRALARPVTVVAVTTDKVYRNREWEYSYREEDELGGRDPYSASKAACEIAVSSWRASFGSADGVGVVTARAGNVLGGGDVSEDRIVPDCFRAWRGARVVEVRQPASTRPWQHVLEPLSGYLALAAHVLAKGSAIETCNFGPGPEGNRTVEELMRVMTAFDRSRRWIAAPDSGPHEAKALALAIDRARHRLGWTPCLTFEETVSWTNDGYMASAGALPDLVQAQIFEFESRQLVAAIDDSLPATAISPSIATNG